MLAQSHTECKDTEGGLGAKDVAMNSADFSARNSSLAKWLFPGQEGGTWPSPETWIQGHLGGRPAWELGQSAYRPPRRVLSQESETSHQQQLISLHVEKIIFRIDKIDKITLLICCNYF